MRGERTIAKALAPAQQQEAASSLSGLGACAVALRALWDRFRLRCTAQLTSRSLFPVRIRTLGDSEGEELREASAMAPPTNSPYFLVL